MKPAIFFSFCGSLLYLSVGIGAEDIALNCDDTSSCTTSTSGDFRKKKGQILAEIMHLTEKKENIDYAVVEANILKSRHAREANAQTLNCQNSVCTQNNSGGKKKRAIIEAIIDEAEKVTEKDLIKELEAENPFETLNSLIDDAHKIEDENAQVDEVGKSVSSNTGIRKEESSLIRFLLHKVFILPRIAPPREVHTLHCYGPSSSQCVRGTCSVACSGGAKVQLFCASNSVLVKNTAVGEMNKSEVSCG